jgi:hypothetical protein
MSGAPDLLLLSPPLHSAPLRDIVPQMGNIFQLMIHLRDPGGRIFHQATLLMLLERGTDTRLFKLIGLWSVSRFEASSLNDVLVIPNTAFCHFCGHQIYQLSREIQVP